MRAYCPEPNTAEGARKPRGGYRLIPVEHLALAWWTYRQRRIRLADLRVLFAAHEMVARRCGAPPDRPRRFGPEELRRLTGLMPRRLQDALRRLQAARLLTWDDDAIDFPLSDRVLTGDDLASFKEFLDRFPNHRRRVPVPRRTLRLLAAGARPALIAAILGHLVWCLYLRRGVCCEEGRVKASWIAATFGISLRRVKLARQHLIALGWLIPIEARQWELNRWGAHVRINLTWDRTDGSRAQTPVPTTGQGQPDTVPRSEPAAPGPVASAPETSPPPNPSGPETSPPGSDRYPRNGSEKNQEPASGGPAGVFISDSSRRESSPKSDHRTPPLRAATGSRPPAPLNQVLPPLPARVSESHQLPDHQPKPEATAAKPDLRNVVVEDLKDTGRLLALYEQAMAAGLVTVSERDRLRFVAAAEHALVIGTRNPCGLFVRLVRQGLWSFVTQDDEDAASARLKRHLYGVGLARESPSVSLRPPRVELSGDARLVQSVRSALVRAGYHGDAFPLLRRQCPEWTRARWDAALAELDRVGSARCR